MIFKSRFNQAKTWRKPSGSYSALAAEVFKAEHTLIAGYTGCGKTSFLRSSMRSFLLTKDPTEAKLILIDPKQFELMEYEKLPHVMRYADSVKSGCEALKEAAAIMDKRAAHLKQTRQKVCTEADIYIIIDELNDLLINKEYGASIKQSMERIITLGRALKIHIIASTQNPNAKTIPANIVDCYTCRIGMSCMRWEQSKQIVGVKGCEALPKHGIVIAVINGSIGKYKAPTFIPEDGNNELIKFWEAQIA